MTIFEEPSIERIVESDEGHLLDFKSARIHPRDLADILIAFANTDGGLVVIGVEKDRRITNREYRELCDVSDFTARADLNDLVQRGLVISEGRGRSRCYRSAGD